MVVSESVRGVGLPRDSRGLVELSVARERVRLAAEFRKGKGSLVEGTWVLESDQLWACLMSLADADEFVREASRIRWLFHPRAHQNLEPLERYGEGILPWLRSFVVKGCLVDVPWCVSACLIALGGAEVWHLLFSLQDVLSDARSGPGPFAANTTGDVDLQELRANLEPAEAEERVQALLMQFAEEHPNVAIGNALPRAAEGDERATSILYVLTASLGPSEAFRVACDALGVAVARGLFEKVGLPECLTESQILNLLDAAFDDEASWPLFYQGEPQRAYHSMRLIAFREDGGDGWVVLFERLEGASEDDLAVRRYVVSSAYGNGVLPDEQHCELFLDGEWDDDEDNTLVGPMGEIRVSSASLGGYEPSKATSGGIEDLHFCLLVRAYLDEYPEAFWAEVDDVTHQLGIDGYTLVVESTAFEHVVPLQTPSAKSARKGASLRRVPSETSAYRSLAAALVARDASLWQPGVSNLDWRLHLGSDAKRR